MTRALCATARRPLPTNSFVDTLSMADGTALRVARWPATSTRMGTLVLLNGRSEYIEKYFEVVTELQERGFAVATLDWRGQGLSDRPLEDPLLGHVENFATYESDLQIFLDDFVAPHCPRPYRMLAHSMGGNIGLSHLARDSAMFSQAIFSAPMWGIGHRMTTDLLLRTATTMACGLGWGKKALGPASKDHQFKGNRLTQDADRFAAIEEQLKQNPALRLGPPTVGWVNAALHATTALAAPGFAEAIETPILVCTAGADRVVSLAAQNALAQRLPCCEPKRFEGSRHEIMMELDVHRDAFWSAFDAFTGSP